MAKIVIVFGTFLVYQFCIIVDAQYRYAYPACAEKNFTYTTGSVYEKNLNRLFENLTSKTTSLKFYNYTTGVGSNQVYGLFQCRNDVSFDLCSACVHNATQAIVDECRFYGEAIVWYHECMLRYANRNIFSMSEFFPRGSLWNTEQNVSNFDAFAPMLATALNGVIKDASSSLQRFASAEANITLLEQIYCFAQCTPDIDPSSCNTCLKRAFNEMIQCCNASVLAMVFLPSCQLKYDTTGPFIYTQLPPAVPPPPPVIDQVSQTNNEKSTLTPGIVSAIIAVTISAGLLVISALLWLCLFRKKPKEASSGARAPSVSPRGLPDGSESIRDIEFVQYDFATLKSAAGDFSAENLLGEGGFGIVYKGTLENGQQLAIKRLSSTSGHGTKEFMVEAQLLAKLQHKNLVKLVGFCSEGDEKLLAYEFMSNSSLDQFLFDPDKSHLLDWIIRHKIIKGIARGLQYLHEDSRLTIVHRDLKPSNILLDEEMNAKIADFGLARLFDDSQKSGNTKHICGTRGYMAPEYMMTGDYSDKSDVYSFGVMLLEILSGTNNVQFYELLQKKDLPIHAWLLWIEKRSLELIDPILRNNCSSDEVMRCVQIGLLCLQASAVERPTMAKVSIMLSSSNDLPLPSTPATSFPRLNIMDFPLPSTPAMSFPQLNMPKAYSSEQQSDIDLFSVVSVTEDMDAKPK